MACDCALYCRPEGTRVQFGYPTLPDPGSVVCDAPPVYRPHHPEFSVFYQVFGNHFDNYVRAYEERFEPNSGPLRRVVLESVEEFLSCGRLQGGFARIRCPDCRSEHLLAFSCRTRNFCGSCQAKRAALFAEKLASEILAPVPHRHWTFTVPKALRGLFERERSLLGLLSRTAYDAILKTYQALFRRTDVRPGCVTSIQTAHIRDRGQHGTRYYGIYANRSRLSAPLSKNEAAELPAIPRPGDGDSDFAKSRRASWARLLRKIFEVDPMLCPCGGKMKIVSVITDPRVVDRILRHLESRACRGRDPFQPRPPPQTGRNF